MSEQREKPKPIGVAARLSPDRVTKLMELYGSQGLQDDGEYFTVEVPDPENPNPGATKVTKMQKFMKLGGRDIEDHIKELIEARKEL